jgi:riboflavin kinase/FMN adenylyltransferase
MLSDELDMRLLMVGPDFALGRNRAGTISVMRAAGRELGFAVEVAPLLAEEDEKVGSTVVRQALLEGNLERVARLLGRPYSLRGPIIGGDRRGHTLGFPTANIAVGLDRALPAYGIYVTRAYLRETAYQSCTSIGVRPTFEVEPRPTVEAYIIDFDQEVYGEELRLDVLHRLRREIKFEHVDELVTQMHRDIQDTREWFRANAPSP